MSLARIRVIQNNVTTSADEPGAFWILLFGNDSSSFLLCVCPCPLSVGASAVVCTDIDCQDSGNPRHHELNCCRTGNKSRGKFGKRFRSGKTISESQLDSGKSTTGQEWRDFSPDSQVNRAKNLENDFGVTISKIGKYSAWSQKRLR
jgi:hypothetical protein